MVEAVVSFASQRLGNLLIQEAVFLNGVHEQVDRLQKELRRMQWLEDHIQELVSELIKEEEQRHVISVVGVGGLGKTTLAKKVYKHDVVKRYFDCFGWTSISQQCSRQCSRNDAIYEILKKASANQEIEANEKNLVEKFYMFWQNKRYLVVLTDIWSLEAWE